MKTEKTRETLSQQARSEYESLYLKEWPDGRETLNARLSDWDNMTRGEDLEGIVEMAAWDAQEDRKAQQEIEGKK